MALRDEYNPPAIGTVFPLRSKYAEDIGVDLVKKIASALESRGLISGYAKPSAQPEVLEIRLNEYLNKFPVRKHERYWIDGGKQVAVFHPDTGFPFFLNNSGSRICRLCNGKHNVGEMIARSRKKWLSPPEEVLVKDLMKFLLLLEELDLVEFTE